MPNVPGDDANESHERESTRTELFERRDEVLELLVHVRVGLTDHDSARLAIATDLVTHMRVEVAQQAFAHAWLAETEEGFVRTIHHLPHELQNRGPHLRFPMMEKTNVTRNRIDRCAALVSSETHPFGTQPFRYARATASRRERAPSFSITARTWPRTVVYSIRSFAAIARLSRPAAMISSTWRSLGVSRPMTSLCCVLASADGGTFARTFPLTTRWIRPAPARSPRSAAADVR